ncbi:hypothetical protein B9T23_13780 [Acinetobacter terrae]|uniref:hypothetical protein n=1 Tax=Acinetobacter terrae TaxID=2731247 RepID=UPI000A341C6C|nr:hypothetical protein [Acinetobacter terrae]OTG73416.1 hypothetical protein B9T23_13780 [Acinetobacter terrae]
MLSEAIKSNAPAGAEFYVKRDGYYYRYDDYEELYYWCSIYKKWIELKKYFPEEYELEPIK